MELRSYQLSGKDSVRRVLQAGKKRPVMVLPTGGGKSAIFASIIQSVRDNGKIILWLVHRRNLVFQMKAVLEGHFGITPGIIMAGEEYDTTNQVQLCTIQTYARRLQLGDTRFHIKADICLIDEAHRVCSMQYLKVLDHYKDKIIIGCTATPCRADGRGLGELFDSIVVIAPVKELTDLGYLVPIRYFVPVNIDLEGVTVAGGDYVIKDLAGRMINTKLIGDIVQNWLNLAENRKTIVYAVNVSHSKALCEEFNKCGVKAEHLDARSSDVEREAVFHRMQRGETRVVCNVALYQEGLDVPDVSCIVMARPTKSLGLFRQCVGRGLRPAPGKRDLIMLDHGNTLEENGPVEWEIEWTLDGKEKAYKIKAGKKEKQASVCRVCHEVFEGVKNCPLCGTPLKSFGKKILTVEAELAEINAKEKHDIFEKRRWWGMYLGYAQTKGYKKGWAYHKYKEKFKVAPASTFQNSVEPIEPDEQFLNHIKYLNIKWAKRRNNERAQESLRRGGELVKKYGGK